MEKKIYVTTHDARNVPVSVKQFPVMPRFCFFFSLTGHKAQGQTMDSIVIHLPDDSIERARIPGSWLYVQFSCVKKLNDLFFDVSINTSRSEILQNKHKCKPMK